VDRAPAPPDLEDDEGDEEGPGPAWPHFVAVCEDGGSFGDTCAALVAFLRVAGAAPRFDCMTEDMRRAFNHLVARYTPETGAFEMETFRRVTGNA
jgi:hypothetical protein